MVHVTINFLYDTHTHGYGYGRSKTLKWVSNRCWNGFPKEIAMLHTHTSMWVSPLHSPLLILSPSIAPSFPTPCFQLSWPSLMPFHPLLHFTIHIPITTNHCPKVLHVLHCSTLSPLTSTLQISCFLPTLMTLVFCQFAFIHHLPILSFNSCKSCCSAS